MTKRSYPRGYTAPLSADGRAALVPAPPWHYSGNYLVVEYRADPDSVVALLPPELDPADDPGAVTAVFTEWQSCSEGGYELLDPVQALYNEFMIVVACKFRGQATTRCVYIWVDKDFAMYRGWIQGFPKKLGSIYMTRACLVGKATARIQPGGQFAATCTAGSREIARAVVTLRRTSANGPALNSLTMHNTRHFPAYNGHAPSVYELVRAGGRDHEVSEIWEGDAELTLGANTIEGLQAIAPKEIIKGYRFSLAYTMSGGEVVAQHQGQTFR